MKLAVCCPHSFFLVFSALILALIVYNSVWLDITVFSPVLLIHVICHALLLTIFNLISTLTVQITFSQMMSHSSRDIVFPSASVRSSDG